MSSDDGLTTAVAEAWSWHDVQRLVQDYEWFHTALGIVGNLTFFIGSILFLFSSLETAGVWLFIVGSFGMLLGSIGSAIVRRARRRHRWARPGSWDDVATRNGEDTGR